MLYVFVPTNLVMITNPPEDITTCIGDTENVPCGYIGVDPNITQPIWRIIESNISRDRATTTINADNDSGNDDGLVWVPDLTSGPNNASGSVLVVGPVNETDDQSSYQCIFSNTRSKTGTITVAGMCFLYSHY